MQAFNKSAQNVIYRDGSHAIDGDGSHAVDGNVYFIYE